MPEAVHLLRGAPPVRLWSKYQSTVPEWTLCGIHRQLTDSRRKERYAVTATEDPAAVTCRYCGMLMRTSAKTETAGAPDPQERKTTAS